MRAITLFAFALLLSVIQTPNLQALRQMEQGHFQNRENNNSGNYNYNNSNQNNGADEESNNEKMNFIPIYSEDVNGVETFSTTPFEKTEAPQKTAPPQK
ncbi:MAG: hypothetical protein WC222_00845 [Parachlamydiales bacterium]